MEKQEILKNRKCKLISKKKITNAIKLFERYVDEDIVSIRIYSSSMYEFKTTYDLYSVNIKDNKVSKSYPDMDW